MTDNQRPEFDSVQANAFCAGPTAGSNAPPAYRAIVTSDLPTQNQKAVAGVAAGYKLARGTASVTGTTDLNTGLTTLVAITATLGEAMTSQGNGVSTSALASAGWTQLQVWKPTSASEPYPTAATSAKIVAWVAVGT